MKGAFPRVVYGLGRSEERVRYEARENYDDQINSLFDSWEYLTGAREYKSCRERFHGWVALVEVRQSLGMMNVITFMITRLISFSAVGCR